MARAIFIVGVNVKRCMGGGCAVLLMEQLVSQVLRSYLWGLFDSVISGMAAAGPRSNRLMSVSIGS